MTPRPNFLAMMRNARRVGGLVTTIEGRPAAVVLVRLPVLPLVGVDFKPVFITDFTFAEKPSEGPSTRVVRVRRVLGADSLRDHPLGRELNDIAFVRLHHIGTVLVDLAVAFALRVFEAL